MNQAASASGSTQNNDQIESIGDFFSVKNLGKLGENIWDFLMSHGPKLIIALLVVFIGLRIINRIEKMVSKLFTRLRLDDALVPFLTSMIVIILKVVLFLTAAGMIGFHSSSLVGVIAAAAFAIGMALQGSLANFASGILILIFKPYKVGDLVDLNGEHGHVDEIQIFTTAITTLDNKRVIIPNSMPLGGNIVNYSEKEYIRVELSLAMPYNEEFDRIETILLDALTQVPNVLETPPIHVGINEFDTHNISLLVFVHCQPENYWSVYFDCNKRIKSALGKAGIKMAYSEGIEMGDIGK